MFDPAAAKALDDRIEPFEAIAPDAEQTPATETLWQTWLQLGYTLQELGVPPKAMCDVTNEVAAARAEVHEGSTART